MYLDVLNKMISVIITTFNRKEMLKRAIDSVLAQTFTDWELIVVDDASTDGTKKFMEELEIDNEGSHTIKYSRNPKNFGCDTQPKNIGARMATGEYIAYLDDDNTFRPDHLQALYNELQRNPKIDVAYGDRIVIDDEGQIEPRMGVSSDFSDTILMQRNYIDTSDVLMKREALFDVGGWDERFKKYVDWNLWVRMAKAGKAFVRVPIILTEYHIHKKMKSLTVKDRAVDGSPSVPLGSSPVFTPEWDAVEVEVELPYLKEVKDPKVAIYMITYDRLEYTKLAIDSLFAKAGYDFDLFVVDNGSTDGTIPYLLDLAEKGKIKPVILNEKNVGISKASNQAVAEILKGDYKIVGKYDNDAISLNSGWLKAMVEIWKVNHKIAMSCYISGLKDNPGGAPRVANGMIKGQLVGITRHLGGICVFNDILAYKSFRWDEDSFLHGVQDMEFSQYLNYNGFRLMYLENYQISHGPMGTAKQQEDFKEYFERRKSEKTTRYESNQ